MNKKTPVEEEEIEPAYMRVITGMSDGLDHAACVALMIGLRRKDFIKFAAMAFDFMQKWHDQNKKDQ